MTPHKKTKSDKLFTLLNTTYILLLVIWSFGMLFYGGVGLIVMLNLAISGGDVPNRLFSNDLSVWITLIVGILAYYSFPFVYYFSKQRYHQTNKIISFLSPFINVILVIIIVLLAYLAIKLNINV